MITMPRPTREVVHQPTREVVRRHQVLSPTMDRRMAPVTTIAASISRKCRQNGGHVPLVAGPTGAGLRWAFLMRTA
jgi:hypothetical protein